jgi:hypothetical protein
MDKGGGAPSTAGLEEATKEATALQREMYEQGREDLQPWYKTGASGMGKLADLLGLEGGSMQSREDIYNELLPQYTSQQASDGAAGSGMFVGMDGALYGDENLATLSFGVDDGFGIDGYYDAANNRQWRRAQPYEGGQSISDAIDYEGLNAAVDERLGSQTTPEGYGSLLERFSLDKFEEDPGYQFRQQQGQQALERAMASQGVTLGGGGYGEINPQAATALQDYSQGLASQEYGNAYNRYNQDQSNVYGRLMGVSGMGQGAAGQQVQAGQQFGTNVGNLTTGLAQAQYQGAQANANKPSMFGSIMGLAAPVVGSALGGPIGGALASKWL